LIFGGGGYLDAHTHKFKGSNSGARTSLPDDEKRLSYQDSNYDDRTKVHDDYVSYSTREEH
jgi:hypothetical protein